MKVVKTVKEVREIVAAWKEQRANSRISAHDGFSA